MFKKQSTALRAVAGSAGERDCRPSRASRAVADRRWWLSSNEGVGCGAVVNPELVAKARSAGHVCGVKTSSKREWESWKRVKCDVERVTAADERKGEEQETKRNETKRLRG